jgi:hypothetical protein
MSAARPLFVVDARHYKESRHALLGFQGIIATRSNHSIKCFGSPISPAAIQIKVKRHVCMTGNEHHWQRDTAPGEFTHQPYAVGAGHSYIGDDAAGVTLIDRLKEAVCGLVRLDGISKHIEHFAQRMPDRCVVVNDKDCRS